MEDVTDTVFREIIVSVSSEEHIPVLFTEFTSVDGLCSSKGRDAVSHRLFMSESEKVLIDKNNIKIVAQIWGNDPEKFFKASKLISEKYAFSGIDINMGCPVKKVVKNNACSALIKTPSLAKEIIEATREGSQLPVSVKTRIGFDRIETEKWITHLINSSPVAISIHGRTQKMQSNGVASWDEINKAVQIRNNLNKDVVIVGNGDVRSLEDGLRKVSQYKVDGVMIGRGIFSNPWFFATQVEHEKKEKLKLLEKHLQLFESTWGKTKNYNILKRFYKIYLNNFSGASALRQKFMETTCYEDAVSLIHSEESSISQNGSQAF